MKACIEDSIEIAIGIVVVTLLVISVLGIVVNIYFAATGQQPDQVCHRKGGVYTYDGSCIKAERIP